MLIRLSVPAPSFYAFDVVLLTANVLRPSSKMVMQRIANPPTPVRFRPRPPLINRLRRSMIYGAFLFVILARFSLEKGFCKLASPGRDVYSPTSAANASGRPECISASFRRLHRATARMAKLVDAWDLKSPARKGVPVRFRLRAPFKIKGLRAKADANPFLFLVRSFGVGPEFTWLAKIFCLYGCGCTAPS